MKSNSSAFSAGPSEAHTRARLQMEIEAINPRELSRMSDPELAKWHACYPLDSGQHHLAMNEWNRRLFMRHARVAYTTTIVGVLGTLVGAALGFYLSDLREADDPIPQVNLKENIDLGVAGQWRAGSGLLTVFRDNTAMLYFPPAESAALAAHGTLMSEGANKYKMDLLLEDGTRVFFLLEHKEPDTIVLTAPTGGSRELRREK